MKMRTEIAAGVAAAIMISLVGCGSSDVPAGPPEIEATDIAIVSGYHQNAVTPPINNSEILKAFEYSTRNNGSVTIVVNDGDPAAVVDFEIDESAVSGLSEARLEQQISEVIDSTNNALASSKANDPEVDTFEAIKQAARGLTGEAGDKCLYILDSGLSTEGELNVLSENLHRLIDVQPIVDKLQKDHALPDLTGVQVVWIGLGDAADMMRLPNKCIRWRNRSRRRGAALCLQRTAFFHSIRRCGRKIRIWPDGFPLKERQSTTP